MNGYELDLDVIHGFAYTAAALWILYKPGNWLCRLLLEKTGLQSDLEAYRLHGQSPSTPTPQPARAPVSPPATTSSSTSTSTPPTPAPPPGSASAGRVIGLLERLLIAAGIVAGSWEILAAVIALKTVARFKEIDDRVPAEYFLVGSLFSITWGVAVTRLWMAYDHHHGEQIVAWLLAGAS